MGRAMNAPLHSLRAIARALGGEVVSGSVCAPGPGHSPRDRSLSITLSARAPNGFLVNSFAGDDALTCLDYVRAKLGLPAFEATAPQKRATGAHHAEPDEPPDGDSARDESERKAEKASIEPIKIMLGPSMGLPIVLAAANDLLAIDITEGIETGLSVLGMRGAASGSRARPAACRRLPGICPAMSSAYTFSPSATAASTMRKRLRGSPLHEKSKHTSKHMRRSHERRVTRAAAGWRAAIRHYRALCDACVCRARHNERR